MRAAIPALLFLLCGCASAERARREVLAVLTAQTEAWNQGDLDGFLDGYWRSENTTFSSDTGTVHGWEAVQERYRKRYSDRALMGQLSLKGLKVTPLGSGTALVTGSWGLVRKEDTPGGDFTLILVKFPEGWKIISDHTSQSPSVKHPST